jgi:hypothetical protein
MTINQQPNWFDATNYDQAKEFTFKDWFNQLFARFMIIESLNENPNSTEKWIASWFEPIKKQTFPKMPESPLIFGHIQEIPINLELIRNKNLVQDNLWSTTTSEAALNYARLIQEKDALELLNSSNSDHNYFYPQDAYKPIINKGKIRLIDEISPIRETDRKTLTVDLNAKDNDIKKDFEKWLTEAKKDIGSSHQTQNISNDKKEIWATTRIIAYFDLVIWSKLENKRVTNETIMDWIDEYSDYVNTTESETYRRKKYLRLRKELLNITFITRLFRTAYGKNISKVFESVILEFMSKHGISLSDVASDKNPMGEALKNWRPKKD